MVHEGAHLMGSALAGLDPETLRKLAGAQGQQPGQGGATTIPAPNDFGAGGIVQVPVPQPSQQPSQSMRPPGQMGPSPPVGPDPDAIMPMSPAQAASPAAAAVSASQKPAPTGADKRAMIAQFIRQQQHAGQGSPGFDYALAELIRRRGRGGY